MDHSINDILLNSENDNNILATIYVCSSMTKEKIERRYIKIQEVGSRVYGIFYVQNIIVSIILYFPQLRLMDIEIINALFDYKPKYFSYKKKKKLMKYFIEDILILNKRSLIQFLLKKGIILKQKKILKLIYKTKKKD